MEGGGRIAVAGATGRAGRYVVAVLEAARDGSAGWPDPGAYPAGSTVPRVRAPVHGVARLGDERSEVRCRVGGGRCSQSPSRLRDQAPPLLLFSGVGAPLACARVRARRGRPCLRGGRCNRTDEVVRLLGGELHPLRGTDRSEGADDVTHRVEPPQPFKQRLSRLPRDRDRLAAESDLHAVDAPLAHT